MHKSKLAGFIIDCKTNDLTAAAKFWGNALGFDTKHLPGEEGKKYIKLVDPREELHIEVQSVDHQSRVHLDIETDNIKSEVTRLEKLGAKVVSEMKNWCVMEAPTGQRFCVVHQASPHFKDRATKWE